MEWGSGKPSWKIGTFSVGSFKTVRMLQFLEYGNLKLGRKLFVIYCHITLGGSRGCEAGQGANLSGLHPWHHRDHTTQTLPSAYPAPHCPQGHQQPKEHIQTHRLKETHGRRRPWCRVMWAHCAKPPAPCCPVCRAAHLPLLPHFLVVIPS